MAIEPFPLEWRQIMEVDNAIEVTKKEIRQQMNTLQALVDELPESKDRALAQIDAMKEKVRVMEAISEGKNPREGEEEPYIGT